MLQKQHVSTGHRAAVYALVQGHSPGTVLSAAGDHWIVEWPLNDPENGRLVAATDTPLYALSALTDDSQRLVAGNMKGGVHWVDLQQPERTVNVQHHQKGVFDLLPVGPWLFSAGGEGLLTRWEAATGRSVESIRLSWRSLRALAFSPERRELAVGASDGKVYFLDADTLAVRTSIDLAHAPSVFAVCYHPTRPWLLTGGRDAMLRVWALPDDPLAAAVVLHSERPAHLFTINHLVFSPDQRRFATASRDKTLKIWDADTLQLLKVADTIRDGGHINSVNRLLWLPEYLVSASDDRSLMWWRFE
jgi:WD40 repeat protein